MGKEILVFLGFCALVIILSSAAVPAFFIVLSIFVDVKFPLEWIITTVCAFFSGAFSFCAYSHYLRNS